MTGTVLLARAVAQQGAPGPSPSPGSGDLGAEVLKNAGRCHICLLWIVIGVTELRKEDR